MARAHQIPIREDKNLVQILSRLELEQEIQPEVYHAVAEILSFIYRVSQRRLSLGRRCDVFIEEADCRTRPASS